MFKISRLFNFVLVSVLGLGLVGCAQKEDVSIVESFFGAVEQHNVEQTKQVSAKTAAIERVMTYDCNDGTEACGVAKAMAKTIAADKIASIKTEPFAQKQPTNSLDVQLATVNKLGSNLGTIGLGITAYKQNDRGPESITNTVNNAENGTVNLDDSMNQSETHATSLDGSSSTVALDDSIETDSSTNTEPTGF